MSKEDDGIFTEEEIEAMARKAVEEGKEKLLNEGSVYRYAYLFTLPNKVMEGLEGLEEIKLEIETTKQGPQKEPASAVVILDLCPPDESLIDIIFMLHPEQAPLLGMLAEIGRGTGLSGAEVCIKLAQTWMSARNMLPKDLVGLYFRHMVRKLDAYAYIHVSEGYMGTAEMKKGEPMPKLPSPTKDPNSQETLMVSWETHYGGEMYLTPFTRTERDVGKVTGFEETHTADMTNMTGNIAALLYNVRSLNPVLRHNKKES